MQLRLQSFMAELFACKNTKTETETQNNTTQQLDGSSGTTNN